jgi:hypothetical protein
LRLKGQAAIPDSLPDKLLPLDILGIDEQLSALMIDDEKPSSNKAVQIQADDFGGGLTMPHYGINRPSADC